MNKIFKIGWTGFLNWLIPFVIAFFFYSKDKELLIDIFLFKSIMIVTGAVVGVLFLIYYFKAIQDKYLIEGLIAGLSWLAILILLDLLILLPLAGIGIKTYFIQTGLRYLIVPITSTGMGVILDRKCS